MPRSHAVVEPARERIDVRLRADQKTFLETAAVIKGVTLTDFILQNALENAKQTIREHETWTLERGDATLFLDALQNPPAPGSRLAAAGRSYRQRFLEGE